MAGDDDIKAHATSTQDFYALLGVTFETSEADIRRAYRRTALKYHPDKVGDNPAAVEKFHLLQIAYDVLSDPNLKSLYDNARRARREKEERDAAFEGRRRQMKEDLERRESGHFKRKRGEDDEEEKLEIEMRRLAEDGKRRRQEFQAKRNRERLEEEERLDQEARSQERSDVEVNAATAGIGGTGVKDIDRTVKVRWVREGQGADLDKDTLIELFSKFGAIEHAILLKEKKKRLGDGEAKRLVATCCIVFKSLVGAHAAVGDWRKQDTAQFKALESVTWAENQEPEAIRQLSVPSTPLPTTPRREIPGFTPGSFKGTLNGGGLRKAPSFPNFKTASTSVPSPSSGQKLSFEEVTMIRLKNAEKKRLEEKSRLEEQIRRDEEEAETGDTV